MHINIYNSVCNYFIFIFLTAVWLPHGQLWAIIGETASFTQCWALCFNDFDLKVTGSVLTRLGPYARPSAYRGLNQQPSDSFCNVLTHYATRPDYFLSSYWKITFLSKKLHIKVLTAKEKRVNSLLPIWFSSIWHQCTTCSSKSGFHFFLERAILL